MTTSKSPLAVARTAYLAAKKVLPPFSHLKSPKKFTLHQLVACLVLKEFFNTDYRGLAAIIADNSDLRKVLEFTDAIPHYTTFQKASARLFNKRTSRQLMRSILTIARKASIMSRQVKLAALDGTGFESHHISRYFIERRDRTAKEGYQTAFYQRFPKAGIICDISNHLIICGIPERGPRFDRTHFASSLKEAVHQSSIKKLVADAGYDGEPQHVLAREHYSIQTIIPPLAGRPTLKLPKGKYRRLMALRFDLKSYHQRWQIETVNSMLKRNLGSFLRARSYWSQSREILLRLFTHNVTIVLAKI